MVGARATKSANVGTVETTRDIYDEKYFQGGKAKSNYDDYIEQSRGPTTILAETLNSFFRPESALDVGCAVGHSVKRLRELGVESYGLDISDWAVSVANVPYVKQSDASIEPIKRTFDLVYSYDVVEHMIPERLEFAAKNLWNATKKDMLIVPATYENGEKSDPNEPTHLIFESRAWWVAFFEKAGAAYNAEASQKFADLEHSKIFNYSSRVMIFSRPRIADEVSWG